MIVERTIDQSLSNSDDRRALADWRGIAFLEVGHVTKGRITGLATTRHLSLGPNRGHTK